MGKRGRLGAAALILALAAAACGGGDDSSSSADGQSGGGQIDSNVAAGVKGALGGDGSSTTAAAAPAKRPETLEEWETLWKTEREAIVKKIKDNKWGKSADGTKVSGPEGFSIDLSKCASGWTDTTGLSDTEIKIGHTTPLSGTAADYGNIARGMDVIYKYYSEKGVFKDVNGKTRNINFTYRDDGYDPAKTIPLVDELMDSEKSFIIWTLGSPNGLKVYDKLNTRCIPHPFEMSGHPAWGDPVNHPWTTGLQMAYNTEAVIWASFIEKHAADFGTGDIRIGSLVANSDFGKAYDQSFKAAIAQSSIKDRVKYTPEFAEISAPTVTNEMTTLGSKDLHVFIVMTGGAQCPQIINEAAQNGMKGKVKMLFMSSVCKAASFMGKAKVGGDGMQSDGWWIVGGGAVDFNAASEDNNPFIKWGRELYSAKGIDYKSSGSYGTGFLFAFPMVQGLQIAGQLDGGLTRSNFITALRAMDMTNPMLLAGVKFNLNGNKDAYFVEGSDISKYDATKQAWQVQGDIIELSGQSRPCAYDQSASACK